jgi:Zn finger protein HypA/HybF involved in hydrogenase expression
VHELGVALELVDAIAARAAGARVRRVVLEIGPLSSVLPDALSLRYRGPRRLARAAREPGARALSQL